MQKTVFLCFLFLTAKSMLSNVNNQSQMEYHNYLVSSNPANLNEILKNTATNNINDLLKVYKPLLEKTPDECKQHFFCYFLEKILFFEKANITKQDLINIYFEQLYQSTSNKSDFIYCFLQILETYFNVKNNKNEDGHNSIARFTLKLFNKQIIDNKNIKNFIQNPFLFLTRKIEEKIKQTKTTFEFINNMLIIQNARNKVETKFDDGIYTEIQTYLLNKYPIPILPTNFSFVFLDSSEKSCKPIHYTQMQTIKSQNYLDHTKLIIIRLTIKFIFMNYMPNLLIIIKKIYFGETSSYIERTLKIKQEIEKIINSLKQLPKQTAMNKVAPFILCAGNVLNQQFVPIPTFLYTEFDEAKQNLIETIANFLKKPENMNNEIYFKTFECKTMQTIITQNLMVEYVKEMIDRNIAHEDANQLIQAITKEQRNYNVKKILFFKELLEKHPEWGKQQSIENFTNPDYETRPI